MTNPTAPDEPIFDAGEISKMPADAAKAWDDPKPFRPPVLTIKNKIKLRPKTSEQYEEQEQKTRAEFRRLDAGYYRGRVPAGSATHRKADLIRAYCRDNGISAKGFMSLAPEECTDVHKTQGHRQRAKAVVPVLGYCHECHKALPPDAPINMKFCPTGGCKQANFRRRKAREDAEIELFGAVRSIAANTRAGHELPEWVAWAPTATVEQVRTPEEQAERDGWDAEYLAWKLWHAKHENKNSHRGPSHSGLLRSRAFR